VAAHRPFGVNMACYQGDYHMAQGCCASVREHLGDVPICLFVDGTFPVTGLKRAYGVDAIYPHEVADDLRRRSYGYGLSKMIVFWHSPYDQFLYLDADTIVWGNVLDGLDRGAADFIANDPHEPYTDALVKSQYFDFDRLIQHTGPLDWRRWPLFNTGAFVAKPGLFSKEEYLDLVDVKERHDDLLVCGDQGILNVLVFRGAQEGRLSVATAPLQAVVPVIPRPELDRRFRFVDGRPVIDPSDRTVIHWAGSKPSSLHDQVFRAPMMHYRRRAQHDQMGPARLGRWLLMVDEWHAGVPQMLPPNVRQGLRTMKARVRRTAAK
jgi:hypothetical protein